MQELALPDLLPQDEQNARGQQQFAYTIGEIAQRAGIIFVVFNGRFSRLQVFPFGPFEALAGANQHLFTKNGGETRGGYFLAIGRKKWQKRAENNSTCEQKRNKLGGESLNHGVNISEYALVLNLKAQGQGGF